MFVFEELKKPVAIKATAWIATDAIDEDGDPVVVAFNWVVKFRRQTVEEEEALKSAARKARDDGQKAAAELPDDPKALAPIDILKEIDAAKEKMENLKNEGLKHMVGWEIDNGKGGLFPEDEETRALILNTKEFRDSVLEAWLNYLNPDPEVLRKNSKRPPSTGQVVSLAAKK